MMFKLDLQLFASKKGVGSTKNGRDSKSKRLGAKLSDGQFATAGSIIYRQRGTKIHPGTNVGRIPPGPGILVFPIKCHIAKKLLSVSVPDVVCPSLK